MSDPAIEIRQLVKRFGETEALAGIDLNVPEGAFCVLLGPSGCGKSTLLRLLAGLETPSGGEIRLSGRPVADGRSGVTVAASRRNLGMVFQSYALWPHKTVHGNIVWPLKIAGMPAAARRQRVVAVTRMLGIEALRDRFPGELSGGQQQRVAIARAIAPAPTLLLFDEPLSNLDAQLRVEMRSELLRVHRETGATVVYVTHDQIEALTMATRLVVMKDGRIEQQGAPGDLIAEPATPFVSTFLGNPPGNLLLAEPADDGWRVDGVPCDGLTVADRSGPVHVFYRPERLTLHQQAGNRRIARRFLETLPIAGRSIVSADGADGTYGTGQGRVTAIVDRPPFLTYGDPVYLELPDRPDGVFSMAGERLA